MASSQPPFYPCPTPTADHARKAPHSSFQTLQHIQNKAPFLVSEKHLPCDPEVPLSGFGYPLSGFSFFIPWGPLSAPNAPGFRPSELFSFPMIDWKLSSQSFRSRASHGNLSASIRRLSGFLPSEKPCPCMRPEELVQGGTSCSLGPYGLSGSLFAQPRKKFLSFFYPSRFSSCLTLRPNKM